MAGLFTSTLPPSTSLLQSQLFFPTPFETQPTKPPSVDSSLKLLPENKIPNSHKSQLSVNVSNGHQAILLDDWPQLLQNSIGSGVLILGQAIHGFLAKLGYQSDAFRGNNLINLYSKFSRMEDAQQIFDEMLHRNTITWTSLISGYSMLDCIDSVFQIARDMHRLEEEFNEHTCSVILGACKSPDHRVRGEQIHGYAVKNGLCDDVIVGTSLISMHSRCGSLEDAEKLFSNLAFKDVRCLNLLISEYGKVGYAEKALKVFLDLLYLDLEPTDYTLTSMISACSEFLDVGIGRQLHGYALKQGLLRETSVGNAIITMYGKYGLVEEAESMFGSMNLKDLVSWTAILSSYVKNGHAEKSLKGFVEMMESGIYIDSTCFTTLLDGCSECKNLTFGLQVHGLVKKLGYLSDVTTGTALIDLYVKCGNHLSAKLVFDGLCILTTASLNALLGVNAEADENVFGDAMSLFNRMRLASMKPDSVTFARLISSSANQCCLVGGKTIHAYAIKVGSEAEIIVSNALISMYAKCGIIKDACQIFSHMNDHDSVSWNALIAAYALHGQGEEALSIFEEMIGKGFAPDEITILSVLQGCSYAGLWDYGLHLFSEMESKYGITPVLEHFTCLVDLLGRAGCNAEALDIICKSSFSDSPLLWRTLVHACKLCGDLHLGKTASKKLLDLAPKEAGSYMLVSNMYARVGMLDESARARTLMNDSRISKEAGCSWIEVDDKSHGFLSSGRDHNESEEIYALLNLLTSHMKVTSAAVC